MGDDKTGKRKRSRWDDDGSSTIKSEPGLSAAPVAPAPIVVKSDPDNKFKDEESSMDQPFKWGEGIKKEPSSQQSKYGPGEMKAEEPKKAVEKVKANFGLTGALSKDEKTGNMRNGVVLKFSEALESSVPAKMWRLYVFDGDDLKDTLHIHREASYLIGKDVRVADILIDHHSMSKQHAVITFRNVEVDGRRVNKPYVMDLKSTNKTFLNRKKVGDSRYVELKEKDCITFGSCPLDYVLLAEDSATN